MKKYLIILYLLFSTIYLNGQVVAEGDTILCDGQQGEVEVTLTATSYAVDLTDSNIYSDDTFGGVIDMGFDFVFYGNTYNQVVLASNNYLSFNTSNANAYSDWTIGAAVPTTTEPETQNAILCPWQDIYPGVNGNGTIQYATTGEAPNRVFIASFCGIPMFSCTDICYSSQIKLFESTNIIETHIAQKVLCTTWNSGAAIHALHNETGTIAHVVTGLDGVERNYPNQWTCENDAWRFTPNGDDDYIIENMEFAPAVAGTDIFWQDEFGNEIGTGGEIVVIPGGDVTYTAGASLCGDAGDWCGFEGGVEGDDVSITFEELSINGTSTDVVCYNAGNGSIEVLAPSIGDWTYNLYSNENLINSQHSSNDTFTFENLTPGTYSVTVTESNSDCISQELFFELIQPEEVNASNIVNDVSCTDYFNGSIQIEITGGTAPYNTFIGNEQTPTIATETGNIVTFNDLEAGNYYFTTIDNNGCLINGDEVFFTINEPSELTISTEDTGGVSCDEASDGFIDITVSGGVPNYTYTWTGTNGFFTNTEDINQISGGIYTITILDENGCVTSEDFSITESEALSIETSITECINNDGIITTNVVGGTPNYSYNLIYEEEVLETNSTGIFSNLNSGTYSVTAYDSFNCDITETITLNSGPIAEFTVDEYEFSLSNIPTEFLDLSIDDNIINWEWEFGDGSSSNEQNPSHLYLNPGIYYITLTITNLYNCQDVITKEIKVLQDFYSYT